MAGDDLNVNFNLNEGSDGGGSEEEGASSSSRLYQRYPWMAPPPPPDQGEKGGAASILGLPSYMRLPSSIEKEVVGAQRSKLEEAKAQREALAEAGPASSIVSGVPDYMIPASIREPIEAPRKRQEQEQRAKDATEAWAEASVGSSEEEATARRRTIPPPIPPMPPPPPEMATPVIPLSFGESLQETFMGVARSLQQRIWDEFRSFSERVVTAGGGAGGAGGGRPPAPPGSPPPPGGGPPGGTPPPGGGGDPPYDWTQNKNFRNAAEVMDFIRQFGRSPGPTDRPGVAPAGAPSPVQTFFDRMRAEAAEPISRYGISSAAYTAGGAIGRLTGSPSAGIISAGAIRGGLSLASSAGLLSAGQVAVGAGLLLGVTSLIEAFNSLQASAQALAQDFKKVSGPIASQLAVIEAQRIYQDIELSNRMAPELTRYLRAQNDFYMEWRDYKARILENFLPPISDVLQTVAIFLKAANKIIEWADWLFSITGTNFLIEILTRGLWSPIQRGIDLVWQLLEAWGIIGPQPGFAFNEQVELFLRGIGAPAHEFPRPPRRAGGVF